MEKGCKQIVRGQIGTYYLALLRVPKPAELPLKLKEPQYLKIIRAVDKGEAIPVFLALPAPPAFVALVDVSYHVLFL